MDEIMVSAVIITYQHRPYIAKALDSVLMQKTKYTYEILVADDYSTDGTRDILLDYKRKYGNRIRIILNSYNMGGTKNGYSVLKRAKGKYIALLEGDDFWTDEYKLDKQVDYMEAHKDCSGVFHRCKFVDENGVSLRINYRGWYSCKDGYTLKDFEKGKLPGQTGSFLYLNFYRESKGKYNFIYKIHNLVGDQTIYCILLTKGKFGYIDEEMSSYRLVRKKGAGNASSVCLEKNICLIMWRYYCQLEIIMKKRFNETVYLKVQRRGEVQSAKYKFMSNRNLQNLYIYLWVFIFNWLYETKLILENHSKRREE